MKHDSETDFEATVAVLLAERANRAVVEADVLHPIAGDQRSGAGAGGPTRWWLAVAAVLVIAGGTALALRDPSPQSDLIGAASSSGGGQVTSAFDVVVWMEVGVEPSHVRDVAALLGSSAMVGEFVYVDQAATWSEFSEYFADEPEIIALVEPEHLPTSFKVRTDAPGSVLELVSNQTGVEEVEVVTPGE